MEALASLINHTSLINLLIERYKLKSYLEIGVNKPERNFSLINIVGNEKIGIEPSIKQRTAENTNIFIGTSDEYFSIGDGIGTFDICFIDGLHHADQVKRDFENSLRCLNDNGFIIIHDTLPEQEQTTCVPRGNATVWHGDVYKFALNLNSYRDIGFLTVNFDNGCTICWKCNNPDKEIIHIEPTWKNYLTHRDILLKIIQPKEILQHLP